MGDARESFALPEHASIIDPALSDVLQRMVGFRNIAVHQYQDMNLDIIDSAIRTNLEGLLAFAEIARGTLADS